MDEISVRWDDSKVTVETPWKTGQIDWSELKAGCAVAIRETDGNLRYVRVWLSANQRVIHMLVGDTRQYDSQLKTWHVDEPGGITETFTTLASYFFEGSEIPKAHRWI